MWQRITTLFRKPVQGGNLLTEFEDSLMLIVDPEQLTNNLLSKLSEMLAVEKAFVYLMDQSESPRVFSLVDRSGSAPAGSLHEHEAARVLPSLPADSRIVQWFHTNRQILFFEENQEVTDYLRAELRPFLELSINLAFPLISMDRLIGIVFLPLHQRLLNKVQIANLQALGRQAALAFENALLFKERLRQNERMFRAEQLATMGQFAAGVAHELRNPLTAIRCTVQYLAGDFPEGSEQKNLAGDILHEVDRLNNIVGNLLSLAQPAESHLEEVDLAGEIGRCLDFIEAKAKSQNVMLKTDLEPDLLRLTFDPAQLRQVLLNIIMNGLQAMPEGGMLSIRASRLIERPAPAPRDAGQSSEGDSRSRTTEKILIEIGDEGPGIPSSLRGKVFEPFFTTKPGGTGLGLAICNSIVKRHNGDIWIDQARGGGTLVKIALPVT